MRNLIIKSIQYITFSEFFSKDQKAAMLEVQMIERKAELVPFSGCLSLKKKLPDAEELHKLLRTEKPATGNW